MSDRVALKLCFVRGDPASEAMARRFNAAPLESTETKDATQNKTWDCYDTSGFPSWFSQLADSQTDRGPAISREQAAAIKSWIDSTLGWDQVFNTRHCLLLDRHLKPSIDLASGKIPALRGVESPYNKKLSVAAYYPDCPPGSVLPPPFLGADERFCRLVDTLPAKIREQKKRILSLQIYEPVQKEWKHIGNAFLFSRNLAITAAHCVYDETGQLRSLRIVQKGKTTPIHSNQIVFQENGMVVLRLPEFTGREAAGFSPLPKASTLLAPGQNAFFLGYTDFLMPLGRSDQVTARPILVGCVGQSLASNAEALNPSRVHLNQEIPHLPALHIRDHTPIEKFTSPITQSLSGGAILGTEGELLGIQQGVTILFKNKYESYGTRIPDFVNAIIQWENWLSELPQAFGAVKAWKNRQPRPLRALLEIGLILFTGSGPAS